MSLGIFPTTTIKGFIRDETGGALIEYGLIAALISVAAIGAMTALGITISTLYGNITADLR